MKETKEINEKRHSKKEAFLAAYSKMANITYAAKASNVFRASHYRWMQTDPDYKQKFYEAHEEACDLLEAEATRRAVQGIEEPIYYQGVECGKIKKYSDTLLIFLLKAARPEKFKDRHEVGGVGGGPILLKVVYENQLEIAKENE
jgi:hypothetical protein